MIALFIEHFILGFMISAIPGAVLFETLRLSLMRTSSAVRFQLGNITGMVVIATAAHAGLITLFTSQAASKYFYILSGLVLLYIGISALAATSTQLTGTQHNDSRTSRLPLLTGIVLSIANPIGIVFWLSILGKQLSADSTLLSSVVISTAIIVGAVTLYTFVIIGADWLRKHLTPERTSIIAKIFGIIIVAYGLSMIMRGL